MRRAGFLNRTYPADCFCFQLPPLAIVLALERRWREEQVCVVPAAQSSQSPLVLMWQLVSSLAFSATTASKLIDSSPGHKEKTGRQRFYDFSSIRSERARLPRRAHRHQSPESDPPPSDPTRGERWPSSVIHRHRLFLPDQNQRRQRRLSR